MAWRCSGETNAQLIANMARNGIFASQRVADVRRVSRLPPIHSDSPRAQAMTKVDRANYVLAHGKRDAYRDSPQ